MNYNLQILAATEKRLSNTLETLEETRSQLAALREIITKIEWRGFETDTCPFCLGRYPKHETDCKLAAELEKP